MATKLALNKEDVNSVLLAVRQRAGGAKAPARILPQPLNLSQVARLGSLSELHAARAFTTPTRSSPSDQVPQHSGLGPAGSWRRISPKRADSHCCGTHGPGSKGYFLPRLRQAHGGVKAGSFVGGRVIGDCMRPPHGSNPRHQGGEINVPSSAYLIGYVWHKDLLGWPPPTNGEECCSPPPPRAPLSFPSPSHPLNPSVRADGRGADFARVFLAG
jgi:hypothetical protein